MATAVTSLGRTRPTAPSSMAAIRPSVLVGPEAVAWSMTSVFLVMGVWGFVHFVLGARTLREDLAAR